MNATFVGRARVTSILLGLVGAGVGGLLGYFAFGWVARQGLYAVALPGALLGLGCGWLMRERSLPLSVICGAGALGLGIFSEWRFMPFIADGSFPYFIAHLHLLPPIQLIMLSLGGVLGFWFSLGRKRLGSKS
jgi:hypothetical protein